MPSYGPFKSLLFISYIGNKENPMKLVGPLTSVIPRFNCSFITSLTFTLFDSIFLRVISRRFVGDRSDFVFESDALKIGGFGGAMTPSLLLFLQLPRQRLIVHLFEAKRKKTFGQSAGEREFLERGQCRPTIITNGHVHGQGDKSRVLGRIAKM